MVKLQLIFVLISLDLRRRAESSPAEQQRRLLKSFVWKSNHFRDELQYYQVEIEHTEFFCSQIATTELEITFIALVYDWAKKYVMSMSTVVILTKLKIFRLNLSLEFVHIFLNIIIKKYYINFQNLASILILNLTDLSLKQSFVLSPFLSFVSVLNNSQAILLD